MGLRETRGGCGEGWAERVKGLGPLSLFPPALCRQPRRGFSTARRRPFALRFCTPVLDALATRAGRLWSRAGAAVPAAGWGLQAGRRASVPMPGWCAEPAAGVASKRSGAWGGGARDPRRVWRGVGGKGKWAWAFLPFPARPLPPAPPRAWREGADRWLAGAEGWRAGARLLPAGLHGCCRRFLWPTGCGSGLNSFGVRSLS